MYLIKVFLKKKMNILLKSINVEHKIANSFSWVTNDNELQMVGDLFGVGLNTTFIIVRHYYENNKIHLRPLIFKIPSFDMI